MNGKRLQARQKICTLRNFECILRKISVIALRGTAIGPMSRKPDLQDPPPRLPQERAEEVLVELERVLGSPLFRTSRRCQRLLRRIVEHTLAGEIDCLKERALGAEVF